MLRETVTQYGTLRGLPSSDPRVTVFKGVPFAQPPVGKNRWRAPQPPTPWEGVLEAYAYAPISVQNTPGVGDGLYDREWHVDPGIAMGEDNLYLNIWTPAKTGNEKFPVLVWYFGGGYQWGYPPEMEFDGERLARRGIIVVSVNYRLNVFGFLAHPEITAEAPEAPGNFGLLDQAAGLKWVYENIAAFGGDPENITIAGQSAGGGSVMHQLTHEGNRPYIKKAIILSAMIRSPYETGKAFVDPAPLADAEAAGKAFFESMGVSSLEEARAMDADAVLAAYDRFVADHPRFFPITDGKFCTGSPLSMIAGNKCPDVPLMAGSTCDEFPAVFFAADAGELEEKAKTLFGEKAETFLNFPEAKAPCSGGFASVNGIELTCASVFEKRAENGAKAPAYCYRFGPEVPGWDRPGVFHSFDLWFFFETLMRCWRPLKGAHYDLSRQMANYWANFIRSGDPNGKDADGTDMTEWKPYTAEKQDGVFFGMQGAVPMKICDGDMMMFLKEETKGKI